MVGSGALEVLLLGPLEARRDSAPLPLGRGKVRMLLADLALNVGAVVSVDRLIDDLWGEHPPRSAAHGVEVYVSQLRTHLGQALVTRPPGYVLELPPERVDARRFADRAADGRALLEHDPLNAGAMLREALSLWRGPALSEFTFEPFAQISIAQLDELRQECLEDRIDADLAAGRHVDLVPELEALVRTQTGRERLREQLMLALYRSGRAPDALAVYRNTRKMLVDELGIEPGPGLRALQAAILRQDDSLLTPTSAPIARRPPQRRPAAVVVAELFDPAQTLDAEAHHALLSRWRELATTVVRRYGGSIEAAGPDLLLAVFGASVAREDDVVRAARAALDLSAAAESLEGARVRIGLEAGEVASGDSLVAGPAVGLAREAARGAEPGAVLAGERAVALLAHAARFAEGTRQLLEVDDEAPAFRRRLDTPLVGRADELRALRVAFAEASARDSCRAVRLVGPAGIGKTRLARELAEQLEHEALVLTATCGQDAPGSAYRPLERIVHDAAGALDRDAIVVRTQDETAAVTLASAFGADAGMPSPSEVAWAFRRFCEQIAAERPLLLVLDDVHWAEPTLIELVEQLAARGRGPMLLLCVAREELAEDHPSFLAASELIVLDALSPDETSALVQRLLDDRPFPEELLQRVTEAAEGNPLYLEQLLAFVSEEGGVVDRPLPPTIQSLLAARIDRLGPGERSVLTRAAIVGRDFGRADLSALLDPQASTTVDRHLRTLAGRGFVREREDVYRFRHALVHEAVYRATAKAERAVLHERLADHLDRAGEEDDLVGFHLERAHELQTELGSDDRHLRQLATDAGTRLGAAGILAWKRNDVPATVGLLRRAIALLDDESPHARELTCELGLALRIGGDADGATAALVRASRGSSSASEAHIELRARLELAFVRLLDGRGSHDHELVELAETAIPTFEALDDDRALGRAWLLAGYVHAGRHLSWKAGQEAAELALVHYQRAGWPAATCLGQLASALYHGPTPADEAAARCEQLLAEGAGGPAGDAQVLVFLAGLIAMLGRVDDARLLARQARAVFDDLGHLAFSGFWGQVAGEIEILAGDPSAAEEILRESCELLDRARLQGGFATRAGQLASVLYAQGNYVQAEEWLRAAESAGSPDDLSARLAWQTVRAKVLARSGERARAQRLGREAVSAAEETDSLNQRARAYLDLAEVLRHCDLEHEATELVERARREYDQKGNVAGLARLAAATPV